MRRRLLSFGLTIACTARAQPEDIAEESSESGAQTTESSESSASSSTSSSESTTAQDESSTGTPTPECGNGIVEPPELCDGAPGCVDCEPTCGFAPPIDMLLTDISWTTSTTAPIPLRDGSGDLIVSSAAGLHRVTADGEEQWVQSEPTTTTRVWALAPADGDHVWAAWQLYDGRNNTAHYARHSVDGGAEVDSFDVIGTPGSQPGAMVGTADGPIYYGTAVAITDTEWHSRIERRDGDVVVWSTDLMIDPQPDGYAQLFVHAIVAADDGTSFVGGNERVDFDTNEARLTKLDANGMVAWSQSLGISATYADADDPQALADGGVVAILRQQYNDTGIVGNTPGFFTSVGRFDADGGGLWTSDPSGDARVQLAAIHVVDDRFVVAGAEVDDHGNATPWLGYLDAQGELVCSTTLAHPSGEPSTIDHFFIDADGGLMVQGFSDDDEVGSGASARWFAAVYPY